MAGRPTVSAYRSLSSATAVRYCVKANFTNSKHVNLIVVKSSLLEVYKLVSDSDTRPLQRSHSLITHGNIESIKVVRFPGNTCDSLLVTFLEAKMSILEFDPATNSIVCKGLHYFDDQKPQISRTLQLSDPPFVRVDPLNRCIVLCIFDVRLLVFPLERKQEQVDTTARAVNPLTTKVDNSQLDALVQSVGYFSVDLTALGAGRVKDITFLDGYYEPSLLILHEKKPTHPGRYAVAEHTCALLNISINLGTKSTSVISAFDPLPHTCSSLLTMPMPIGGALIFSVNAIFHFNNQSVDYGLSLNEFGDRFQDVHMDQSAEVLHLDLCRPLLLHDDQVLLSLEDGRLYLLTISSQHTATRRLRLNLLGTGVIASDMCALGPSHLFIGSRVADSQLIRLRRRDDSELAQDALAFRALESDATDKTELRTSTGEPKSKRVKNEETDRMLAEEGGEMDDELARMLRGTYQDDQDDDEGGGSAARAPLISRKKQVATEGGRVLGAEYELTLVDRLLNIGPVGDFDIGHAPLVDSDDEDEEEMQQKSDDPEKSTPKKGRRSNLLELVACGGSNVSGSLSICSQGIVPDFIGTEKTGRTCFGCWTVCQRMWTPDDAIGDEKTRPAHEPEDSSLHSYLLISTKKSTLVLSTGLGVQEVDNTDFYLQGATLGAGNVFGDLNGIVQVHRKGVRLLDRGAKIMDIPVDDEQLSVKNSYVVDPYVVLLMSDGSVRMLVADEKQKTLVFLKLDLTQQAIKKEKGKKEPKVTAVALYKGANTSKLFTESEGSTAPLRVVEEFTRETVESVKKEEQKVDQPTEGEENDDDLEKMLYGSDDDEENHGDKEDGDDLEAALLGDSSAQLETANIIPGSDRGRETESSAPAIDYDYFCVLYRGNRLEIYSLPTFKLIWSCQNFSFGANVLVNDAVTETLDAFSSAASTPKSAVTPQNSSLLPPKVVEMCMCQIGSPTSPPYLMAFLDTGDLIVYQCFEYPEERTIPLRMSRVHHNFITRPLSSRTLSDRKRNNNRPNTFKDPNSAARLDSENDPMTNIWKGGNRLTVFQNVCDRRGVLVGGYRPAWIFGERDFFRIHSMVVEEERPGASSGAPATAPRQQFKAAPEGAATKAAANVFCSTPFHNVNCDHGFIYFDISGTLNICALPSPRTCIQKNLNTVVQDKSNNAVTNDGAGKNQASSEKESNLQEQAGGEDRWSVDCDSELCVRTVPLKAYPRFIVRHEPTQTYAVVVSKQVETMSMEMTTDRSLPVYKDVFEVLLYSPNRWEPIGRFDAFEEHEVDSFVFGQRIRKHALPLLSFGRQNTCLHLAKSKLIN